MLKTEKVSLKSTPKKQRFIRNTCLFFDMQKKKGVKEISKKSYRKSSKKGIAIVVVIVVLILAGVIAYFYGRNVLMSPSTTFVISDEVTGTPIVGAKVTYAGEWRFTDSNGQAELPYISDLATLIVFRDGYQPIFYQGRAYTEPVVSLYLKSLSTIGSVGSDPKIIGPDPKRAKIKGITRYKNCKGTNPLDPFFLLSGKTNIINEYVMAPEIPGSGPDVPILIGTVITEYVDLGKFEKIVAMDTKGDKNRDISIKIYVGGTSAGNARGALAQPPNPQTVGPSTLDGTYRIKGIDDTGVVAVNDVKTLPLGYKKCFAGDYDVYLPIDL